MFGLILELNEIFVRKGGGSGTIPVISLKEQYLWNYCYFFFLEWKIELFFFFLFEESSFVLLLAWQFIHFLLQHSQHLPGRGGWFFSPFNFYSRGWELAAQGTQCLICRQPHLLLVFWLCLTLCLLCEKHEFTANLSILIALHGINLWHPCKWCLATEGSWR